uniref:Uncharacterized protein n=1 Tax=Opuntia streptacantha TaxID=393608 RepID=A0A7C9D793_OPUST
MAFMKGLYLFGRRDPFMMFNGPILVQSLLLSTDSCLLRLQCLTRSAILFLILALVPITPSDGILREDFYAWLVLGICLVIWPSGTALRRSSLEQLRLSGL